MVHGPGGAGESLDSDEELVARLDGIGATLLVTERRVIIVRAGSGFRPRSGIRSWSYGAIKEVSLSQPLRGQAQIMVRTGRGPWQAVSMFFPSDQWSEAQRLVHQIRRRINTRRTRP
jgi:hypothetical protein